MNWLDDYILTHKTGYLLNYDGGLWVETDDDWVKHAAHGHDFVNVDNLVEISKEEFTSRLLGNF